ncbi:hypothetical protein [Komagataeibacter sp. FNDCF1]|uniref:hypothetical protein n=1 Tax=Komagataeibacter sp. FNDCF1 TaxID=2878681 RepID=UPI001E42270E|nr:hypothetical protein [Komagataeibacter sp. FNDCF1]MCE2564035.1 hypothetical protein [Komagataeibacter sp. FNDCF1]
MTKRLLSTMLGSALLCATLPAIAAPATHHGTAAAATDAQTDDLNAQSLQKARAALQPATTAATAPASSPAAAGGAPVRPGPGSTGRAASHAVQAAGTGETSGTIPVPRTQAEGGGAGY